MPRSINSQADFNAFISEDFDKWVNATEIQPEKLHNKKFTIHDIDRVDSESLYHSFKWRFLVQIQDTQYSGETFLFAMNPAKRRNLLVEKLKANLPAKNMTIVQKDFTDMDTGKTIVYYELENIRSFPGTLSH